jgi:hypothetical protein
VLHCAACATTQCNAMQLKEGEKESEKKDGELDNRGRPVASAVSKAGNQLSLRGSDTAIASTAVPYSSSSQVRGLAQKAPPHLCTSTTAVPGTGTPRATPSASGSVFQLRSQCRGARCRAVGCLRMSCPHGSWSLSLALFLVRPLSTATATAMCPCPCGHVAMGIWVWMWIGAAGAGSWQLAGQVAHGSQGPLNKQQQGK